MIEAPQQTKKKSIFHLHFPFGISFIPQAIGLIAALVIMGRGLKHFWGFVQDDSYISLRYARNLIAGEGLVFNPGERVEGYTNLGWTLLGAAFELVGVDGVFAWQVLGCLAAGAVVIVGYMVGRSIHREFGGIAVALLIASSPIIQCWSVSALESTPFALLVLGAAWAFGNGRTYLCYVLLGLAQWLRPEAVLGALTVVYLTWAYEVGHHGLQWQGIWRSLRGLWIFLAFAIPVYIFRLSYYGEWVPNTFLVKGAASWKSHQLGLVRIYQLADKAGTWWLWLALAFLVFPDKVALPSYSSLKRRANLLFRRWFAWVVLALLLAVFQLYMLDTGYVATNWNLFAAAKRHAHAWYILALLTILGVFTIRAFIRPPKSLHENCIVAWAGLFWLGYLYYFIRVGGDALILDRLYLPAVPVQAVLVVAGVTRLIAVVAPVKTLLNRLYPSVTSAEIRGALFMLMMVWVIGLTIAHVYYADRQNSVKGVSVALDKCHGRVGRVLQMTAEKYDFSPLVLAQDMGYMTVSAPRVRFFDTVGLVTRSVAEVLYEYRYSPYWRFLVWHSPKERERIQRMELQLKQMYSEEVKPDYVVANVDIAANKPEEAERAKRELEGTNELYWRTMAGRSDLFYHWPQTVYFRQNYRFVKAFSYSTLSFLTLWRRNDAKVPVGI